jgi:hypothetical protein
MEQFFTPQYLVIFGICAAAALGWYLLARRKRKFQKITESKAGAVKCNPIKARLYDRTTIPYRVYNQEIPPAIVMTLIQTKNVSRQVIYMGQKLFPFFKMLDGNGNVCYEAVTEPINVKHSPISLHSDIQHYDVPILDDVSEEKNFMQKHGHLLLWAGIIAFLIVMVLTSK